VEADPFANQSFYFALGVAYDSQTGEVRAVGSPEVALALDYDQILAHLLCLRSPEPVRRIFAM
jgi:hypothetical protein